MMASLSVVIPVSFLMMVCAGAVRIADKQCPHLGAARKANKKTPAGADCRRLGKGSKIILYINYERQNIQSQEQYQILSK